MLVYDANWITMDVKYVVPSHLLGFICSLATVVSINLLEHCFDATDCVNDCCKSAGFDLCELFCCAH